ncbi:hypothetical protein L204_104869 [Cryptococcus depauperatus]|nr:hypothetical protein L204_05379 [Cryptococcus depauperatus CBS 7855]
MSVQTPIPPLDPVVSPPPSAPLFFSYPPRTQLLLHSALGFSEFFSAIVPPAYLISTLFFRRRPFSVRGLMVNSMGGVVSGSAAGVSWGYVRGLKESDAEVRARLETLASDGAQVRRNDYATIGAVLTSLLAPAMFLRRAPLYVLVLGGASMGLGAGATSFMFERLTKGNTNAN